jgi:hypothetical protein
MVLDRPTCSSRLKAAGIATMIFVLAVAAASCTSQERKSNRPSPTMAPAQNANDCPKPAEPPSVMSRLTYQVAVVDFLNLAKCDASRDCIHDTEVPKRATGEVTLETMSDFSMKFISGQIIANLAILPGQSGLQIPIDITKVLGQFSPESTQCDPQGNLSTDADGRILMTKRLGNIQFQPPRPLLLGPVIQDPSDFDGLQRVYPNIHYSSVSNSTGSRVDGHAGLVVKVINTRLPLKVQYEQKPIEVLHWEMTLDPNTPGSTQNMEALLPKRLAFYWRTRPIQIPRMVIETSLGALVGGSLLGGGGGSGGVTTGSGTAGGGGGIISQLLQQIGAVRIMLDAKSIQSP